MFLSISYFDRWVSAELEQESQASSCVEEWNSACLSSCSWGDRPLVELYLEPASFLDNETAVSVSLPVVTSSSGLNSKRCLGIRTYLEWMGKSVSFGVWHDPQGFLSISADWNTRVTPPIVLRNGTPLASGVLPRVTGHLSSCIWNLHLFPDNASGVSFPLVL